MSDDPLVTIGDLRRLYCAKGVKRAMEAAGMDFADFVRNGARASQLRGMGYDAMVDRAVESKRERNA